MKRIKMREARRPDEGAVDEKPVEVPVTEATGLVWAETPSGDSGMFVVGRPAADPVQGRVRDRLRQSLLNPAGFQSGGLAARPGLLPGEDATRRLDTLAELTLAIGAMSEPSIFERIAAAARSVGRAAGGASTAARVLRAQPFIDPTRAINIDPAEPGSDITVVTVRNPDGLMSVPRADGISRSDIQDALRAALEPSTRDRETDANRALAQGWRRQYFQQTTQALHRESGVDPYSLAVFDLSRLRGHTNDLDAMFERLATLFTMPELHLTTFWGTNTARVGIILLTGGNAEAMVGFKVTDPATWYYQELDLGEGESSRRAKAVGLIIGWAIGAPRT